MARSVNNSSSDHTLWSTAKLVREINGYANMTSFGVGPYVRQKDDEGATAFIQRQTQLYRNSWLNPLLDELRLRTDKKASWLTVNVTDPTGKCPDRVFQIEVVAETMHEAREIVTARYRNYKTVD